ncbi:MAG: hypothetical protein V1487_01930 [bacterium]
MLYFENRLRQLTQNFISTDIGRLRTLGYFGNSVGLTSVEWTSISPKYVAPRQKRALETVLASSQVKEVSDEGDPGVLLRTLNEVTEGLFAWQAFYNETEAEYILDITTDDSDKWSIHNVMGQIAQVFFREKFNFT